MFVFLLEEVFVEVFVVFFGDGGFVGLVVMDLRKGFDFFCCFCGFGGFWYL